MFKRGFLIFFSCFLCCSCQTYMMQIEPNPIPYIEREKSRLLKEMVEEGPEFLRTVKYFQTVRENTSKEYVEEIKRLIKAVKDGSVENNNTALSKKSDFLTDALNGQNIYSISHLVALIEILEKNNDYENILNTALIFFNENKAVLLKEPGRFIITKKLNNPCPDEMLLEMV